MNHAYGARLTIKLVPAHHRRALLLFYLFRSNHNCS
jgi:hypothetical protein